MTIKFTDVTNTASDFISGRSYGAGSWSDFNGDDLPDLWVNNHFGDAANLYDRTLFVNNGDGTFTEVISQVMAGTSDIFLPEELQGDFHGSTWVDFDNDGDQDLLQLVGGEGNTTTLGEESLPPDSEPNRLYVNEGGVLRDRAADFGLGYDSAKAQAPIFLDYNNDGRLDLFHGSTQRTDGLNPTTVFRQQNDNGFADVGQTVLGCSCPQCCADQTGSGIQGETVRFGAIAHLSTGPGTQLILPGALATILDTTTTPFSDVTETAVESSALLKGASDLAVADFNNDLMMDVYLTRNQTDRLLLNTASGLVDASGPAGVSNAINQNGQGVVAADFDNDMDVDIYIVRGVNGVGNAPNLLYENQGDGTFVAIANAGGAQGATLGIGDNATTADYDVDGFVDLFVTNGTSNATNGPQQLFRNQGNSNKWLQIDLEGVVSNRDGIGAQVYVTTGGVTQRRDQMGGVHKRSQNHQRLHFGLGQNNKIDLIEIRWPSGTIQKIENVSANQVLSITESNGGPNPNPDPDPDPDPNPNPNPTSDYLFSLQNSVKLDGERIKKEDIVRYDGNQLSLFLDGSDIGLNASGNRIAAFDVISETEILMSFSKPITLAGIGTVDDSDVVKFTASSLGETTAGTFDLYLDGSDVGLTTNGEDIDGLTGLPDGSLLISVQGKARVEGAIADDEDLLLFTPTSLGENTSGSWTTYFDGSDVGLGDSNNEDIDAVGINAAGQLIFSTTGNFDVDTLTGADEDIFAFIPTTTGSQTSGSFASDLLFDGSDFELARTDISGVDFTFV